MLPFLDQRVMEDEEKFDKMWKNCFKGNLSETSEKMSCSPFMEFLREYGINSKENIYVIIDEAQILYSKKNFWGYMKYFTQYEHIPFLNIKFLCFATYGSTILGNCPSEFRCLLGLKDILLTDSEYDELLMSYNNSLTVKINPEYSYVHDWLKSLTGLHIGFLRKTLFLIYNEFRSKPHRDQSAIMRYLLSSSYLKQMDSRRAIPQPQENSPLTEIEKNLLKRIYRKQCLELIDEEEIVLATKLSKYCYFYQIDKTFFLPCPVAENIIARTYLFGKYENEVLDPFTFSNFIFSTLQHLSQKRLKQCAEESDSQKFERLLQIEFYSFARKLRSNKLEGIAEVRYFLNAPKLLHFSVQLNGKFCWGIQLLYRSNDGGKEHLNRFKKFEPYSYLGLDDYCVLNFIRDNDQYRKEERLWNVLHDDNWKKITIINDHDEKFLFELKD